MSNIYPNTQSINQVRNDSSESSQRNTIFTPSAQRNHAVTQAGEMISAETQDSTLILKFHSDRFDATNSKSFMEATTSLSLEGLNSISLDFEKVKLIDSSAVGILLDFYKSLPADKRSISILNPQPSVASMIEFLRLHRVFKINDAS